MFLTSLFLRHDKLEIVFRVQGQANIQVHVLVQVKVIYDRVYMYEKV